MTDPARISDLLGLRSENHDSESVWPLNFVLVVLGAAILGVAFAFLDLADPRPLYNPWTYAIATPVTLLGLSALLSTVVGRVVEKSMQLAFLLSVLIHLVLLVCAVNVVIFSRMWPDVLDSLAQQREQLKRETLHAKQYHRVSITNQTGRRPDYLRPVATEHQPTEVELSDAPMLALARSDRANLVSPSPKVELPHSPSLLERDQAAASLPSRSEQAASLSRSEIVAPRVDSSRPTLESQPLDTFLLAPMSPSPSALARKADARSSDLKQSPAVPLEVRSPQAAALDRSPPQPPAPAIPTQQPQQPAAFDRQRLADAQPSSRVADQIAVPDASLPLSTPAEVSPSNLSADQRRSPSSRSAAVSPLRQPPVPAPSPHISALANRSSQRESRSLSPSPAANDTAATLPRDMAGGSLGAAAPSSMPVRGIEDAGLAQPSTTAEVRIDSTVTNNRRSPLGSSPSQLPMVGSLGAKSWNGTPSLAGGTVGEALNQLTRNSEQGSAATQDAARLAGAARDLERSALSRNGNPSPTAARGIDSLLDVPNASGGTLDFSGDNPAALAASGAAIGRSTSGATALDHPLDKQSLSASLPSSSSLGQALGATRRLESPTALAGAMSSDALATGQLPKNAALALVVPGLSTIDVPELEDATNSASDVRAPVGATSSAALTRRSATDQPTTGAPSLPSNLLAMNSNTGPGGIASTSDTVGALLNRRDSMLDNWTPPQLEAQQLARQDVGGPLAAGNQVALPKPAFQQRLDRLKDRNPQDESSLAPQTELAIERGLEFLAKHQRPDGSWRLQDFDTPVLMRSDTAATGLALLAFQGAGYTHNQFKYAANVDKALQFLVQHQSAGGDLYIPQDPASDQNAWLYSHAIASLALCEAVGMTQDDQLRPAAQKAINFMVASQDPRRGGWRYRPGVGADTSVTGWFMMAFKSGQLAGLTVPEPTMQTIEKFVGASQSPDGEPHLYRYNPFAADTPQQRHGLQPTSVMTSVGLLMRLYFGWKRDRPEMMAGADYLLRHPPENGSQDASLRDTYYWYYATQFMFHMRGQWWKEWHDRLYPLLINSQITEGELMGSWDPDYPTPDLWARYGGRLYVTTLNLLSLEVSYRHLPLYEATAR